jgi:hypothetical protein
MKKEYNFSQGESGKFYCKDAEHNLPIYLDADNLLFVTKIARRKKSNISEVVNDLIRSDKRVSRIRE